MGYNPEIQSYKRHHMVNRATLKNVITGVKTKMNRESDPEKKRMWAEIGYELNLLLLQLE